MTTVLKVGDRVAFTRESLATFRDRADMRGEIVKIEDGWLAHVAWEGCRDLRTVNLGNLCRPRSTAFIEGRSPLESRHGRSSYA